MYTYVCMHNKSVVNGHGSDMDVVPQSRSMTRCVPQIPAEARQVLHAYEIETHDFRGAFAHFSSLVKQLRADEAHTGGVGGDSDGAAHPHPDPDPDLNELDATVIRPNPLTQAAFRSTKETLDNTACGSLDELLAAWEMYVQAIQACIDAAVTRALSSHDNDAVVHAPPSASPAGATTTSETASLPPTATLPHAQEGEALVQTQLPLQSTTPAAADTELPSQLPLSQTQLPLSCPPHEVEGTIAHVRDGGETKAEQHHHHNDCHTSASVSAQVRTMRVSDDTVQTKRLSVCGCGCTSPASTSALRALCHTLHDWFADAEDFYPSSHHPARGDGV